MPLTIVILAGGTCPPELEAASGERMKARVRVGGRSLLQISAEAAHGLGDMVVVGDAWPGARSVPGGLTMAESLDCGWSAVGSGPALFVTADLPDLSGADLRAFLGALEPGIDLGYPVVSAESCGRARPGIRRTTLPLREGRMTGGNAFLMTRKAWSKIGPLMDKAYARRKSPLALAALAGPRLALLAARARLAPGSVRLESAATGVGDRLGLRVKAVALERPGLANDLDSAEHFRLFAGEGPQSS
jgi:hypothetical protein